MKRIMSIAAIIFVLCFSSVPEVEASTPNDIQVHITSPASIDSVPIYNDTIIINVTNTSEKNYYDLDCYLNIVDAKRKQTYPVDEFGENAYQTYAIPFLAKGESIEISIPVRIMYVGNFRFTASVIDYITGQVFTGNSISVLMAETSHLNKYFVIVTAILVPILLTAAVFLLKHGKKKAKE